MFIGRTFGSYFPVVRSSFSMLWRDFAPELLPPNFCGIHTFNIFTPYHHTPHAMHVTLSPESQSRLLFFLAQSSLHSLADTGFDSFESVVCSLHCMHSFWNYVSVS